MRRGALLLIAALSLAPELASAQPKSWIWESEETSEEAGKLFRFSPRLNLWVASFDRPPRACKGGFGPTGPIAPNVAALRTQQFEIPELFCPSEGSSELAFGSGLEIGFRAIGPVYLTAGVDFVYTAPEISSIKNQLVLALPFGVLLTWYEWVFRPIVHFEITPVLYVTDDSRDFTLGGNGGVAYRILDFGSISLTAGYMWAETMNAVQVQLGLHPIL